MPDFFLTIGILMLFFNMKGTFTEVFRNALHVSYRKSYHVFFSWSGFPKVVTS